MNHSAAPTAWTPNNSQVNANDWNGSSPDSPLDLVQRGNPPNSNAHSLAALWARKYFVSVMNRRNSEQLQQIPSLAEISSAEGRRRTAAKLTSHLNLASAQAWSLTERLLSTEIRSHAIDPELINPVHIAADSRELFQIAFDACADCVTPQRLSVIVSTQCGQMRRKYTADDPRAIGFVSIQFHYTGRMLMDCLSTPEQVLFEPYLKVMDDHMYMPLRDAYQAAASHTLDSPVLRAVQHLLPESSKIARSVCDKICRLNPSYQSHSGLLSSEVVRTSSLRDVEMFQVYLCLCVLEDSIRAVQRELFPLCVMLYPPLGVNWKLVQDMLQVLTWEMVDCLDDEDIAIFLPYLRVLADMFSSEVFQDSASR